jgi:hypothetical protein
MVRHARIPWWWRRLITVRVLMWPPSAKLPRSAPAVLNGRCRARLDMSWTSLCVVLRGLPASGRSVTFPVWRKRFISRTMMEWLPLKWSATLLRLKPPICMPIACHLSGMVNFRRTRCSGRVNSVCSTISTRKMFSSWIYSWTLSKQQSIKTYLYTKNKVKHPWYIKT